MGKNKEKESVNELVTMTIRISKEAHDALLTEQSSLKDKLQAKISLSVLAANKVNEWASKNKVGMTGQMTS